MYIYSHATCTTLRAGSGRRRHDLRIERRSGPCLPSPNLSERERERDKREKRERERERERERKE
jgi:hypothetical protein